MPHSTSRLPGRTRARFRLVRPLCLGTALLVLSGALLHAATPVFWRVSTQDELLRGEVEALAVDATGRLTLGRQTEELFDTSAPVAWSLAPGGDEAVWVGTGSDARLYLVEGDDGREVYDAEGLDIYGLAPAPGGDVYVATSPDGAIERVSAGGAVTPVFDPDVTYIWALAVDAGGTLFAATGEPARVYRIPTSGQPTVLFESDATHILSLAVAPDGALLVGTQSPGQVLRIGGDGDAFVLVDTAYDEVRSVRVNPDGSVLAVALSGSRGASPSPSSSGGASTSSTTTTATVSVTTTVSGVSTASAGGGSASSSSGGGGGSRRGAVYQIAPDGLWERLWRSTTDAPYDAIRTADGRLIVGTGPDGKIYEVLGEPPRAVLLGQAPAQQVTRWLVGGAGSLRYATANPGKVLSLDEALAPRGVYRSEVRDAATVSRWGTIRWHGDTPGGSRIEVSTRSGNTALPNDTWSDWSTRYAEADGSQIASPNGRYLQWRAALIAGDAAPTLTSVSVAYLPRNLRPEVTSVTVHSPGTVFQQPFASGDPPLAGLEIDRTAGEVPDTTATLGRQTYRRGIRTFVWEATDGNGDDLEYEVAYRAEGDETWALLMSGLARKVFAWDTSSVPDGAYQLRIAVSDAPGNAPEAALVGTRESSVFDIDNTAPAIAISEVTETSDGLRLVFTVEDSHSPIRNVEVSQGRDQWRRVYPVDGIPDGLAEAFSVDLGAGDGPVIIRATDALRNTSTASGR